MAQKCASKRHAVARAKKKEKQVAGLTTDTGASTTPVDSVASTDPISETAIESDKQVAVTARSLKAKKSTRSRLGAGVWHTFPCFFVVLSHPFWINILGGSVETTDVDVPVDCPSRKSSQAIKALLDQIYQAESELGDEQSDDETTHQADFPESEPESDSNQSSEEEPIIPVPAPSLRPAGRKKLIAKVADSSNASDDNDGMDLICMHSAFLCLMSDLSAFIYRAFYNLPRDRKSP
jgi:hypothetical protein